MKKNKKRVVLTIGGFDPSGGAGVLADFQVLQKLKVPSVHAITANTYQVAAKFLSYRAVSAKELSEQLKALLGAYEPVVVKIGMLGSVKLVDVLLKFVRACHPRIVIWDPIWRASAGPYLIDVKNFSPELKKLLLVVNLWIPNLPEAKWILGKNFPKEENPILIAKLLYPILSPQKSLQKAVILKGGHLPGEPIDVLYDGEKIYQSGGKRLKGKFHGSGCRFASSLAGHLFLDESLFQAVKLSKNLFTSKN
ncbi:MAG: bifunctional hydroxymethylpyrimidine kinase/phosphomethylpyrimidine kinase [Deltaproteobacteria bacterium]|nr:bifunctional hydroxymethylpyrimidine kinase/phosphomethylpyrimidine kinase [Deltaproteobacteria bacterium]